MTREHNERMTMAWYIAAMPMMKQFPKLDRLLHKPDVPARKGQQTPEQQMAVLKSFLAGRRR